MEKRLELFVMRETELMAHHARELNVWQKRNAEQEAQNNFLQRALDEKARQVGEKESALADLNARLLMGKQFETKLQNTDQWLTEREEKLLKNEEQFRTQSVQLQQELNELRETLRKKEFDLTESRQRMLETAEQQRQLLMDRQAKLDAREGDLASRTTQQLKLLDEMMVKKDTAIMKLDAELQAKRDALEILEAKVQKATPASVQSPRRVPPPAAAPIPAPAPTENLMLIGDAGDAGLAGGGAVRRASSKSTVGVWK
jgi:hypothetical protein